MNDIQKCVRWPHISQIVVGAASGIIFGVGISLWSGVSVETLFFLSGLSGLMSVFFFYRSWRVWVGIVLLVGLLVGFVRSEDFLASAETGRQGEKLEAVVTLVSTPRVSGRFVQAHATLSDGERILVTLPKHAEVQYGSLVAVTCTRSVPEAFHTFDYPKYLLMARINYMCEAAIYEVTGSSRSILTAIASVRRHLEGNIAQLMSAPESALANGLIFGGDDRLSKELQNAFAVTGMSHIVAVSGYNVTIIVLAVTGVGIFLGLWRKQAALLSICAVLLFVAMIGFPASGVRAALMGTLVLFAVVYGRATHALGALVVVAAGMLLWSPLQLRYDVGFQLSFLAVLGIMLFYPLFEKFVVAQHKTFSFLEVLFLTVSAQLFVLPVILFHFHTLSTSSLVTNVLILPIIPFTMLATFLAALFSLISFTIAAPFAWIGQWLLSYEIYIIDFFAHQTWNSVQLDTFSLPLALLYYIALLSIVYYFYRTYEFPRT